jgi:hypothetical protein
VAGWLANNFFGSWTRCQIIDDETRTIVSVVGWISRADSVRWPERCKWRQNAAPETRSSDIRTRYHGEFESLQSRGSARASQDT